MPKKVLLLKHRKWVSHLKNRYHYAKVVENGKVCWNLTKCTTTIDFGLTSVFFINLEYLSHTTLVLLFILWKGKFWLKVRREWCEHTMMLTYSHNHAPGILLWQCSYHRNEKQNSESFFNYDANLTSVITMELKSIFFSLRCCFLCITSLSVTSSMLTTSVKFWGTSFKFWLRPCLWVYVWFWKFAKTIAKRRKVL